LTTTPKTVQPADSPDARRYNRIRRWLGIADFAAGIVLLVLLLATGWTDTLSAWAYLAAGEYYTIALFFYVLLLAGVSKILGIGFDFYGFRLEHQYGLSNQKFGSWLWDECKGWLIGLVMATIAAEFVYGMMRIFPQKWWLVSWAAFVAVFVLMAQLAPVILFPIFFKFKPLDNDKLKERLINLSQRAGTRVRGVYEWKLSEKSNKANAALTGLGKTRRIIIADTLLENYSDDEIEAVLAHELGHHVHDHILKSIFVQAVITLAGFYIAARVLHWYCIQQGIRPYVFADLPVLALVSAVLSFAMMPALNAWSRHNERQADTYAFKSIRSVNPFISSMNKLADQNLAEREPSRLVEFFFHSHPSISKRIAAAQAWVAAGK
jgi:Zn-dependent protease with chaperone function